MSRKNSFKAKSDRKAPRRDRTSRAYPHGIYEWQLSAPYDRLTPGQRQFVDQMTDCADQVYSQMREAGLMVCLDIPDTSAPEALRLIVNHAIDRIEREGLKPPATIAINFHREGDL